MDFLEPYLCARAITSFTESVVEKKKLIKSNR